VTNCPRCGAPTAPTMTNCANCGTAFGPPPAWGAPQPFAPTQPGAPGYGPPGYGPPGAAVQAFGPAPARPRASPVKWIALGCGGALVLIVAFVVVLVTFVFGVTQPVVDASDRFLGDLKRADYGAANGMSTPALQAEVGGAPGLQRRVESGHARPTSWSYSSRNITNGMGHVSGTAKFADGGEGPVEIQLEQSSGHWLVSGFKLRR
jgi:zinc-ribbon domain